MKLNTHAKSSAESLLYRIRTPPKLVRSPHAFFFPRTTAKGRWPRGGVTGSGLSASGGRRLRGDAAHGTFVGFEFGSWRWGLAMKPWDWKKYHYIPQNVKTNLRWYILMKTAFPVTSHKQTLRNHGNGLGVNNTFGDQSLFCLTYRG